MSTTGVEQTLKNNNPKTTTNKQCTHTLTIRRKISKIKWILNLYYLFFICNNCLFIVHMETYLKKFICSVTYAIYVFHIEITS